MGRKKKEKTEFKIDNGVLSEVPVPKQYNDNRAGRSFCLICYIDYKYIIPFLKRSYWIAHWAVCHHDKDTEEGQPKPIHTHILLYTFNSHSSSAIAKKFNRYCAEVYRDTDRRLDQTLAKPVTDMVVQWRYLLHLDDPDKYRYDSLCRICDSEYYWYNLEKSFGMTSVTDNKGLAVVEDILAGVSERDLVARYGNAFIWHRDHYIKQVRAIIREDMIRENANKHHDSVQDIVDLILSADSPLPKEQIDAFYNVLAYIKAECIVSYERRLEFLLKNIEN